MKIDIGSKDILANRSDCLAIPLLKQNRLTESAGIVNDASGGQLQKLIKQSHFKSEPGNTIVFHALEGVAAKSVMLYGVGNASEILRKSFRMSIEAVPVRLASENCI